MKKIGKISLWVLGSIATLVLLTFIVMLVAVDRVFNHKDLVAQFDLPDKNGEYRKCKIYYFAGLLDAGNVLILEKGNESRTLQLDIKVGELEFREVIGDSVVVFENILEDSTERIRFNMYHFSVTKIE